mmetsp:Transcript_40701/g.118744  ORF Transcript_40701/g.118744 Transcript_40701/m.118744 type:complete len:100 (+) Transcript_40701:1131-1430(+)
MQNPSQNVTTRTEAMWRSALSSNAISPKNAPWTSNASKICPDRGNHCVRPVHNAEHHGIGSPAHLSQTRDLDMTIRRPSDHLDFTRCDEIHVLSYLTLT